MGIKNEAAIVRAAIAAMPSRMVHRDYVATTQRKVLSVTPSNVITARTVPLSALWVEAPNWANPRLYSGLADDEIDELGASIKAKGINDPLKVQRILVNGNIIDLVIDGQRRYLAAKNVLPKNAPIPVVDIEEEACELTPEKADELLLKALTTLERDGLSSFELSTVAERMKARNKTGEYIASAIGKSPSWVSKIMKARSTASPKLILQWRKGEITDEQFKDLAEVKDQVEQAAKATEVVKARKSGDKGEARMHAKEVKETVRAQNKPAKVVNGHATGKKPIVAGPQVDMFDKDKGKDAEPKKPAPPKMVSRLVLEEMIGLADKRPPVADYVKGVMDGVRYALGVIEPDAFGKPWNQYLARIEGRPRPAKKAKATKVKRVAKARRPAKKAKAKGKAKR